MCIAVVSENHKPDQAFGLKFAGEVALGIAEWGFSGGMISLDGLIVQIPEKQY